jgi:hypothetical protein
MLVEWPEILVLQHIYKIRQVDGEPLIGTVGASPDGVTGSGPVGPVAGFTGQTLSLTTLLTLRVEL